MAQSKPDWPLILIVVPILILMLLSGVEIGGSLFLFMIGAVAGWKSYKKSEAAKLAEPAEDPPRPASTPCANCQTMRTDAGYCPECGADPMDLLIYGDAADGDLDGRFGRPGD